ncbi:NADPH-dependent FMN reductase [Puerhibacterium sp. TATVAM-FAB25]|uniref:NADPH-dependent FMN reductase n=1 Tax=Puerhibacterium sp. TATVAM-FAB25 TaxID=3093699 RepID=UPI00397D7493
MPSPHSPAVVVLSGNPRPGSRTLGVAETLGLRVADLLGTDDVVTIDLAALAGQLFAADRPAVDRARDRLAGAAVAVVATPVYKASYTGLLKSFLDTYGPDGLAGVVAVPLVVSGDPAHALAGEVHLRPLLVELGAVVPARSFTVTEAQLADPAPAVDAWLDRWAGALARAVGAPAAAGAPAVTAPVGAGAGAAR